MSDIHIKNILASQSNMKDRFIPEYGQLKKTVDQLKKAGYRIVLTQGVYDLIHQGHALYLEAARSHGDILIVGVDSDELTRKRKGPDRPIVPQDERLRMLLHLRHVDIVTVRELRHGLGHLIKTIKPDVLIVSKSTSDFTAQQVKEYKNFCKKIVTLPPQATTTTTARVRLLTIDGVNKLSQEISKLTENFIKQIKG